MISGKDVLLIVHDFADAGEPLNMSPSGVKALSAELRRLQEIEADQKAAADLSGPERFRVVATDNFGGDYPNEKFVGPYLSEKAAGVIANALNSTSGPNADRFYKVVPSPISSPYQLQPGFEP